MQLWGEMRWMRWAAPAKEMRGQRRAAIKTQVEILKLQPMKERIVKEQRGRGS